MSATQFEPVPPASPFWTAANGTLIVLDKIEAVEPLEIGDCDGATFSVLAGRVIELSYATNIEAEQDRASLLSALSAWWSDVLSDDDPIEGE